MTTQPRKKAAAPSVELVEVTPVSSWKKPNAPMTLPTGKVIKLRRAGMQAFLKAGIIPNSLMTVVQDAVDKGVAPDKAVSESSSDNLNDLLEMVDEVTVFCALEPRIYREPKKEEERDNELLYVDEVDDEDKMFIFQWATGGTADVEQFRKEAGNVLDLVRASKELEQKSK